MTPNNRGKAIAKSLARETKTDSHIAMGAAATLGAMAAVPGPHSIPFGIAAGIATILAYALDVQADKHDWFADDPPRSDYDKVSLFTRRSYTHPTLPGLPVPPIVRPPSIQSFVDAASDLAELSLEIARAMDDVVTTFERSSAADATAKQVSNSEDTTRGRALDRLQAQVLQHNLSALAELLDDAILVVPRANVRWYELRDVLLKDAQLPKPDERKEKFEAFIEQEEKIGPHTISAPWHVDDSERTNLHNFIDRMVERVEVYRVPEVLLDPSWQRQAFTMSQWCRQEVTRLISP